MSGGMSSPFALKDVELLECDLKTPTLGDLTARNITAKQAAVFRDARNYMTSLNIYESVFNPTLTGELRVQDDMNLSSVVPLMGIENLSVKFRVFNPRTGTYRYYPYQAATSTSAVLNFAVYNQTERIPQSQGSETYRLGLASPELLKSSEKRFSRVFKNLRVEQVINTVLSEYIGTTKPYGTTIAPDGRPYFEPTFSADAKPFGFVAPYITPLNAIKLATLQAYTPDNRANFFFYETLDGFYFRSLQEMVKQGRKKWNENPVYVRRQAGGLAPTRAGDRYIAAEQIDIVNNFDFLYGLSEGYFSSATIGVDVLAGQYRVTTTSVNDNLFKSRERLNARPLYPPEFATVAHPTARVFVVPTTSISAGNDTSPFPREYRPAENFIEQTLAVRNRELLELQMFTVRVKVAGAPNLNVGSVVHIEIPNVLNNDTTTGGFADLRSGLYIILAVKHTIINMGNDAYQYETTFEACSDSIA